MERLACAIETAKEAAALLEAHRGKPLQTREKSGRGDLVTAADRASEALIVRRLREAFPEDAILGEEGGTRGGSGGTRWIVDPLDGTTNYAHGYPLYCISIAFEVGGEVAGGVVLAPRLNELYAAERGAGATCNGAPIAVSDAEHLNESLVCTGFMPAKYERNLGNFSRLSGRAQAVRRDGAAALDLAFVACGRFEAFWEFDLAPWDVAAGALLVREAGGAVSAIDGGALCLDGASVLASNGRVHAEMLDSLRE